MRGGGDGEEEGAGMELELGIAVAVVVVVVVVFSSLATIWGDCSTIHSLPTYPPPPPRAVEISSCTLIPLHSLSSLRHCGEWN